MGIKYFESLSEGQRLQCRSVPMTIEAIIDFAKRFDPQIFHVDEQAANESIFNGLVASSLHTLSACTRVVFDAQGGGYRNDYERWRAAFPDGRVTITNVIAEDDWVVVEFTNSGTNTGSLRTAVGDFPPTNRKIEVSYCSNHILFK